MHGPTIAGEAHIGRTRRFAEVLEAGPVDRLAGLFDMDRRPAAAGDLVPEGWQWVTFCPKARQSEIGPDGHPDRGGFLPDLDLRLRMFGGADATFHRPLKTDHTAELVERIVDIRETTGNAGRLAIVKLERTFQQFGRVCLVETQTIIYREPGPAGEPRYGDDESAEWRDLVEPDPVSLFRFSALTYNGHRIHYDRDYAMNVEGYPGLVVHGPFVALSLLEAARRRARGRQVSRFTFRSAAPLFDTGPFHACGRFDGNGAVLWAENDMHGRAMSATVEFHRN